MTKKKENPKPRGGARPNAGRKPGKSDKPPVKRGKRTDTVPLLVKVRPNTNDIIRQIAKRDWKTLGQVIDERFKIP